MSSKLPGSAYELSVTEDDIREIRRAKMRGIFIGSIIAGSAIVSLLVGKLIGSHYPAVGGYPYSAVPALALRLGNSRVYHVLAAALIASMGLIGFAMGSQDAIFGEGTYYGTYSRTH